VGAIYGRGYEVLRSHAALYVQATEVGGTHPALVEAMGSANAIIANDVPEHRETLGEAGRFYRGVDELSVAIAELLADEAATDALRVAAHRRAEERFGWESIVTDYERWFSQLIDGDKRAATG
jgi:glycosyltransferase involved in cell wall biosynthesis